MVTVLVSLPGIFFQQWPAGAQQPDFSVASIRQAAIGSQGEKGLARENIAHAPDSLTMRSVTIKRCIQWAWDVADFQVAGPAWISSDRFDIVAKAGMPASETDLRLMLRSLPAARASSCIA